MSLRFVLPHQLVGLLIIQEIMQEQGTKCQVFVRPAILVIVIQLRVAEVSAANIICDVSVVSPLYTGNQQSLPNA